MMAVSLWILGCIALGTLLLDLVCYTALTPDLNQPRTAHTRSPEHLSKAIYAISYVFGLLRTPYAALPYLGKLCLFLILRKRFWAFWHRPSVQIVRLGGDFANLMLTTLLIQRLLGDAPPGMTALFHVSLFAEGIRTISEKMQTAVSGVWQLLPHQRIAASVGGWRIRAVRHYAAYYGLRPDQRAEKLVHILKQQLHADVEATAKLAYLRGFQIVSNSTPLRTGDVRDIALGDVYIHPAWTNDPWLLIGQALRRSPWIFDPRNVERPLYYRTHTNRVCTLFVFDFAMCTLPYAIYQFGHEIKVARYDAFFRALRWAGLALEEPVRANGAFQGDGLLRIIGRLIDDTDEKDAGPMRSDADARCEIEAAMTRGETLTALEIARRYAYPLCYVEELLLPAIYAENAARTAEATA